MFPMLGVLRTISSRGLPARGQSELSVARRRAERLRLHGVPISNKELRLALDC
jgi:hypothetical protein